MLSSRSPEGRGVTVTAFGRLHLKRIDKIFIASVATVVLALALVTWRLAGGVATVLGPGVALCALITIQVETYRRLQRDLRAVSEGYFDITGVLSGRRSVRKYSAEPVRRQDLLKMLEAARMAPSGANTQPWHFLVIQNRDMISRMASVIRKKIDELPGALATHDEVSPSQTSRFVEDWRASSLIFDKAPATIAVLVKDTPDLYYPPYVRYVMEKKGLAFVEAQKYMGLVEIQSVAAAIENLLLAAHSLGYGTCWLRVPFMAKDELEELLVVRPPWYLIALVPVGRPGSNSLPPKRERKKIEEIATFL